MVRKGTLYVKDLPSGGNRIEGDGLGERVEHLGLDNVGVGVLEHSPGCAVFHPLFCQPTDGPVLRVLSQVVRRHSRRKPCTRDSGEFLSPKSLGSPPALAELPIVGTEPPILRFSGRIDLVHLFSRFSHIPIPTTRAPSSGVTVKYWSRT